VYHQAQKKKTKKKKKKKKKEHMKQIKQHTPNQKLQVEMSSIGICMTTKYYFVSARFLH